MILSVPTVSISSIQRSNKPMLEKDLVCVVKNNKAAFYTISPERLYELLSAEEKLKELQA